MRYAGRSMTVTQRDARAADSTSARLGRFRRRQLHVGEVERGQPFQAQLRRQPRHAARVHHRDARGEPHDRSRQMPMPRYRWAEDHGLSKQPHASLLPASSARSLRSIRTPAPSRDRSGSRHDQILTPFRCQRQWPRRLGRTLSEPFGSRHRAESIADRREARGHVGRLHDELLEAGEVGRRCPSWLDIL